MNQVMFSIKDLIIVDDIHLYMMMNFLEEERKMYHKMFVTRGRFIQQ